MPLSAFWTSVTWSAIAPPWLMLDGLCVTTTRAPGPTGPAPWSRAGADRVGVAVGAACARKRLPWMLDPIEVLQPGIQQPPVRPIRQEVPSPALPVSVGWLCDYAIGRDPALRQRIILAYLGLADRLASRYRHSRGTTPEDLRQTARAGLIAAVDRYDPTHGTGFVPFAVASVVGELKRDLRDTSWRLHVPGHSKNKPCRSARRSTSSSKPSAVLRPPASWPRAYRWPRSRCWRRWRSLDAAKSCPWTARSATTSRSVWVTFWPPPLPVRRPRTCCCCPGWSPRYPSPTAR